MDPSIRARFETKATVFKALAHPTRLFIVDELSRGARCVCELTAMVGDDVSTVSKHLSILKAAGIVRDEKRGSQVFYSLRLPCVLAFFSCVDSILAGESYDPPEEAQCGISIPDRELHTDAVRSVEVR